MDILNKLGGTVLLVGVLLAIAAFFLLPRLKSRRTGLMPLTILAGVLALASLALGLGNLSYWIAAPSSPEPRSAAVIIPNTNDPLVQTYKVQQTLSEHGRPFSPTRRPYSFTFPAEQGYRIIDAKIKENSATRVSNLRVEKSPDGSKAIISFELTSGPQFDRYRGWIDADVEIVQEKVANPPLQGHAPK